MPEAAAPAPALPATAGALLEAGRKLLKGCGPDTRLDLELLTATALGTGRSIERGIGRTALYTRPEQAVPAPAAERCLAWYRARAAGWPLAYLLGRKEFWSLDFLLTPDTLVPRPETEHLLSSCLEALPEEAVVRVAELGTGCGAVAIALARERPRWHIQATDLSPAALTVARRNALRLGTWRLIFRAGDWFQALAGQRFDLVLSNPPYVSGDDPCLRGDGLCREPRLALDGGPNGLRALRHIISRAPAFLHPGGLLCLEHGATQGAAVRAELRHAGFHNIRTEHDLAGHPRVSLGRLPNSPIPPAPDPHTQQPLTGTPADVHH